MGLENWRKAYMTKKINVENTEITIISVE